MGRYGMLKCANNFSNGHGTKICEACDTIDDETHRINQCTKWRDANLYTSSEKTDYDDIYSEDTDKSFAIVEIILSLWDLENGKNEMRQNL